MKLSGRKFFQPLRSAWNPPIGDALKTCALVSPGSRRLTSIYIKSLRTCRLHGGDLCAEMFRKSPLQPPARPFSQKPPRTSFFDRHGPSGPSDFQYRVVRRLLLPVAGLQPQRQDDGGDGNRVANWASAMRGIDSTTRATAAAEPGSYVQKPRPNRENLLSLLERERPANRRHRYHNAKAFRHYHGRVCGQLHASRLTLNSILEPDGLNNQAMTFNVYEFAAILHLAKAMASADDRLEEKELAVIVNESKRFGVEPSMFDKLLELSNELEFSTAISLISKMDAEQKKYVAAYLGALMCIDGDINDTEMALWRLVSTLCGLPTGAGNHGHAVAWQPAGHGRRFNRKQLPKFPTPIEAGTRRRTSPRKPTQNLKPETLCKKLPQHLCAGTHRRTSLQEANATPQTRTPLQEATAEPQLWDSLQEATAEPHRRNSPVLLSGQRATSSAVPQTTMRPPALPPPGPMSTI